MSRASSPGQLVLDGPTLALIFQGQDLALGRSGDQEAEPGRRTCRARRSPSCIVRTVRARPSSSRPICRVSNDWKTNVGADTAIDWPTGIGAKGNEGVAGNVAQIAGAIGYVEYAYAKQNHLSYTKMINKDGKAVEPTVETFKAGAASADWGGAAKNDFYVLFLD